MNYRHVFHAGNFADVFKHAVLARILAHLADKPQPFRVIDTHAGAGLYDLSGAQANRTGEWRDGIGRMIGASLADDLRALLAPYLEALATLNPGGKLRRYPGSPVLALAVMRPQDRLTACELEPHAAAALGRHLRSDRRAKAIAIDGWQALKAYVPPVERRGVVLIDPPFEDADEFDKLLPRLVEAHRKWATGTYMVWYPIKGSASSGFVRRLRQADLPKLLRAELHVAAPDAEKLTGSGLIILNPPWRLRDELRILLPGLLAALQCETSGRSVIEQTGDKI
jgi:23S rRNA (adenine2030-N6)-methyltransferase